MMANFITPLRFENITSVNADIRQTETIIADHTIVDMVRLDQINESVVNHTKTVLHIAYGHTSHGSQVISGMSGLPTFKEGIGGIEGLYDWNDGPLEGALDIDDYFVSGDLGNPDRITWANRTRDYLDNPSHSDVNVVMWSWCGQVSSASEVDINLYLNAMTELENEYPSITFIYMTGHVDGTGLEGNLHIRNEQIRDYCTVNGKALFDFADIESYDPDGNYFGDKYVTDSCSWNNGTHSGNWATEWQDSHIENVDWYSCSSAHSQPLNANMKAYAAWWLFCRIAGWNGTSGSITVPEFSGTGDNVPGIGIILIFFSITLAVVIFHPKRAKKVEEWREQTQ